MVDASTNILVQGICEMERMDEEKWTISYLEDESSSWIWNDF